MPTLNHHHSHEYVKLLLLGDAKSGKTTSLASLAAAGYSLRILDFDNLLDPLRYALESQPQLLARIEYRSLRDKLKGTDAGMMIDGKPRAWTDSLKLLNNWTYTDPDTGEITDLGAPATWGPDVILVIDSLSRWCDAAYDFHAVMTPGGKDGKDGRAIYGNTQDDVEKQLAALTSPTFGTNVIVICHGTYMTLDDGTTKIFPQGVGQKLSPKIPQYFPNYIRYINKSGKRTIQLQSDPMISLANARPNAMPDTLSTNQLAEFFAVLRSPPAKTVDGVGTSTTTPLPVDKPKAITLRRV